MAESQCKAVEIKSAELLHWLTAIFADTHSIIFLTASVPLIVMPCVPRTLHSFVPQSLRSLHNLCLHGIRPAENVLRGESGGRPVPVVRARLVPRQLPPQPPYAGSGSRSTHLDQRCSEVHLTLTVCCVTL